MCDLATFGLHKKDSFYQDFDSTSVVYSCGRGRRSELDVCLFALGFEGVDRTEAVWKGLQTEIFRQEGGREQIEKRERSCVQAEAPASSLRSRAEICPA